MKKPETSLPSSQSEGFSRILELASGESRFEGLQSAAGAALVLSVIQQSRPAVNLWLCHSNREAEQIGSDLRFFLGTRAGSGVTIVPGPDADPYRGLSPHPAIAEMRALGLWELLRGEPGFVVTTLESFAFRLPDPRSFEENCTRLEIARSYSQEDLLDRLRHYGYVREEPVSEVGEFSHRGGIVDFYSPAHSNPVRLEFFGDELESIREFDPATQRSIRMVTDCRMIPMREWLVDREVLQRWHREAPEFWKEGRFSESLQEFLQFTRNGELFNGFEYLFPLVLKPSASLLDYASFSGNEIRVILPEPESFLDGLDELGSRLETGYRVRVAEGDLALSPGWLFWQRAELERLLDAEYTLTIHQLIEDDRPAARLGFQPVRRYHSRIRELLADLESWQARGERTVFVMGSKGMAERLVDILGEYEVAARLVEGSLAEAARSGVAVVEGRLSEGLYLPQIGLRLLTQQDVFEEARPAARREVSRYSPKDIRGPFLSDFRDLREGDLVVHVDHGIGQFAGLKRIGHGKDQQEFVELVYREGSKLYLPVERLDLIQKYAGGGGPQPLLDRLGGVSWEKTKSRIRKSIRELAGDLLKLYAQRELARGHAFSTDDHVMREFEAAFEFEETLDQAQAIADIKRDMESERPMDRLVCGDVGYGKTEVAMRAALKAVADSRQVAVLAPTTVLAFQHLNTFMRRFQGFPVKIGMVSRFEQPKDQKTILEEVKTGLIDIIIGTHRLLSKDVGFSRLGLIIVDEEQRFGVAQKEQLKKLKTEVDVLSLSATPIPRTLNMSLLGVRDLSVIETPPRDRLAVQTVVLRFSKKVLESAIDLEMKRKGQVFFVHNSVETIYSIAQMVQKTVPQARVAVAHGQMPEKLLEKTMIDFVDYRYDVLIATTIIENGLDVPRANTLIVNRADRFGLSQLYQLRGRVGRSNRRAYAFLMIPDDETLTSEARKRLAAIREFSELGAGFRIAAMDLEIRGAGNLLGAEQHGHISAVGLDLYLKLLEQEIREMKGEEPPAEEVEVAVNLHLDIRIPEHYISDPNQRLFVYKQLASCVSDQALEALMADLSDRFGRYPKAVLNLFEYARIRLLCRPLRIQSIDRSDGQLVLQFREDTPIEAGRLVQFVHQARKMFLRPDGRLVIRLEPGPEEQLLEQLQHILEKLGECA